MISDAQAALGCEFGQQRLLERMNEIIGQDGAHHHLILLPSLTALRLVRRAAVRTLHLLLSQRAPLLSQPTHQIQIEPARWTTRAPARTRQQRMASGNAEGATRQQRMASGNTEGATRHGTRQCAAAQHKRAGRRMGVCGPHVLRTAASTLLSSFITSRSSSVFHSRYFDLRVSATCALAGRGRTQHSTRSTGRVGKVHRWYAGDADCVWRRMGTEPGAEGRRRTLCGYLRPRMAGSTSAVPPMMQPRVLLA